MEVDGERKQKVRGLGSPFGAWCARMLEMCAQGDLPTMQGRGFRDPTSLADRLEGGTFERLPSAGVGPGPQKCECRGPPQCRRGRL